MYGVLARSISLQITLLSSDRYLGLIWRRISTAKSSEEAIARIEPNALSFYRCPVLLQSRFHLIQHRNLLHNPRFLLLICVSRIRPPAIGAGVGISTLMCNNVLGTIYTTFAEAPFADRELNLQRRGKVVLAGLVEGVHLEARLGWISRWSLWL